MVSLIKIIPNIFLLHLTVIAACSISWVASASPSLIDCNAYAKLASPATSPATELFVIVDQTTPLNLELQQLVANNIKPFLVAGNSFAIIRFSAFTQGHYTETMAAESLNKVIGNDERDGIGKLQLAKFDQCMAMQPAKASQLAGAALKSAFLGAASDVAKSDILASLKNISMMVKQSGANEKVILVVSDMLENSSITSFYSKKTVRKIDPAKELAAVEANQLFADFGGARVYVVGAGLLAEDVKQPRGVYRDPKTMAALKQFWQRYFQNGNAQLVEFGEPALLNAVH